MSVDGSGNLGSPAADYRCGCTPAGITGYGGSVGDRLPQAGPVPTPTSFWDIAKAIVLPDPEDWQACAKDPGLNSHCGWAATDCR
ncbi:hypothetical protein AB0C70_42205 [Streptomyces sp. NPDC048564]|uniref:hypothetical protein n=1 Tax=Streptomyces sp. NPDC048564 TaxID=3155760 RepID=UPI00341E5A5F